MSPALTLPSLLLAPTTPEAGVELGFGWALVKMLVALLVVCVGAYLLLRYGLRRLAAPRLAGRNVRVIERCPLSANRALWVVEVGQRCFLIGEADAAISMLAEIPRDELTTPAAAAAGQSFLQLLRGPPRRPGAAAAPAARPPEPAAAVEEEGGPDGR